MATGASGVDEILWEVLCEADLENFANLIAEKLQCTKFDHFTHVKDADLYAIGLSQPAVKRLRAVEKKMRNALKRQQKCSSKLKNEKLSPVLWNRSKSETHEETSNATCLISKDDVKLFETLGEGSFGIVKRAVWRKGSGRKVNVAVKLLRSLPNGATASGEFSEDTLQEINAMHALRHPNLIRLYGLILSSPIMMVTELCEGGALLDRLRSTNLPVLLLDQLLDYGVQIATGMAYLEMKLFIHRDLAARNVLLSLDEKVAKIGDFGLMRSLSTPGEHYVMTGQKKVPFAWCPPESLKLRKFSSASDVWAFGVTLWEMFSFGEEPWCTLAGAEILQKITVGERLPEPQACPSAIFQLMLQCWSLEPGQRPTFAALKELLSESVLTIGKCKEAQTGEGLLELDIGDGLIIIDGNVDSYYWFGQNLRTRKLGKFARKNIVFEESIANKTLGDREKGSSVFFEVGGAGLSSSSISRPIRGSFVHTGHGDARGGTSWGQPDKIDPIFLNNPLWIPPSTKKMTNLDAERLKASSRDDQQALLSHDELVTMQHNPNDADVSTSDRVPRRNESFQLATSASEARYISSSTNTSAGDSSSFGSSSGFGADFETPVAPPNLAPVEPQSRPYYSLVPPTEIQRPSPTSAPPVVTVAPPSPHVQRLYDDVPGEDPFEVPVEVKTLTNRQRYREMYATAPTSAPLLPPPPSAQYSKVTKKEFRNNQQREKQMFQFASTMPTSVKEVKPVVQTLDSSPVRQLPTTTFGPNVSVVSPTRPAALNHTGTLGNSRPVAVTQPFLQQPSNGPFTRNSISGTYAAAAANQSIFTRQPQNNVLMDELSRKLQSTHFHTLKSEPNGVLNPTMVPSPSGFVWTGGTIAAGSRTQSVPDVNGALLTSSVPSTARKMTNVDPHQLLDLFDPLANRPPPDDLISMVRVHAPFASVDRCSTMLRRCQMNVQSAVAELKMEKLLDMGIAADRSQCVRALETSDWDVNAAASKLLG